VKILTDVFMENAIKGKTMPVGIQDFEKLRTGGCLYVDKTEYVFQLTRTESPYFLGRPRRFGKSLFLSTLKAYFLGKKELFDGLKIAELEKEWTEYPVFHLDMNVTGYLNIDSLYSALNTNLRILEEKWGKEEGEEDPAARFYGLIRRAYEKKGRKVVVLVDEYDKPLLNLLDDPDEDNPIRKLLKGFYGILKSADAYLRFVFLTGVTKFSKVSVFSDLNHLTDISLNADYAAVCGISETELDGFKPEITALAGKLGLSYEETLAELKKRYNGYRFTEESEGIYNPYSLLRTFVEGKLRDYWFETGTPTFLVKMLKNINFDVTTLEKNVDIPVRNIFEYKFSINNPIPLLYQSGYLTIKGYNARYNNYVLGFPNEEVKYGFLNELMPVLMDISDIPNEFLVWNFVEDLQTGNINGFMNRLRAFFAGIPYMLDNKTEKHYQTIFYVLVKLMGQFTEAEMACAAGRADVVVKSSDSIYVFEFKLTGKETAEDALKQIDGKGYLIPFTASGKRLVKIGAEFSAETRVPERWLVKNENEK
jgi:hypothetical protein